MGSLKKGFYMAIELLLKLALSPRLRASILSFSGAKIGHNVRVYSCTFINLKEGFRHLVIGDDVHIGTGCLIDLEGEVNIGKGSTISPRVTIISHTDAGSAHGSPIANLYPPSCSGISIGEFSWIGACSTLLDGAVVGDRTIVGAMSLVRGRLENSKLYVGIPARPIKELRETPDGGNLKRRCKPENR